MAFHEAGHCAAALQFGIPIIRVTISEGYRHMHRGHYRAPLNLGVEIMATFALSGPAAERLFCGPIIDGSEQTDIEMAREYLARRFQPALILVELHRHRDAADALVRTPWGRSRIERIAASLLERRTLTGEEIGLMADAARASSVP